MRISSSPGEDCCRDAPEEEEANPAPDPPGVVAPAPAPVAAMACSMAALNMSDVMAGLEGVGRDEELADEDVDGAMKALEGPTPPDEEAAAGAIPVRENCHCTYTNAVVLSVLFNKLWQCQGWVLNRFKLSK